MAAVSTRTSNCLHYCKYLANRTFKIYSGSPHLTKSIRTFHLSCSRREVYQHHPHLKYVQIATHGATYKVPYVDEGPRGGATVLCIHGAPGGCTDFDILAESMVEAGVRIVAPNLPSNHLTTIEDGTSVFNHSTPHRAQFMQTFLEAIEISNVDVALGHSMGGPVVLEMAANTELVKSLALVSSCGCSVHRDCRPHFVIRMFSRILSVPLLRKMLSKLLVFIYTKFIGFKVFNVDHLANSIETAARVDFPQVGVNADSVSRKSLPVLGACCQNDRVMEWEVTHELLLRTGVREECVTYMDEEEGRLTGPSIEDFNPSRAFVFAKGGHFPLRSHKSVLMKSIIEMINHVKGL